LFAPVAAVRRVERHEKNVVAAEAEVKVPQPRQVDRKTRLR